MSLSDSSAMKNPAVRFYEWKNAQWKYWDKEESKSVVVEKIFVMPIDKLATIKGFNDSSQSSIYSNEVHNIKNEELIVKSFKGGPIASGLYSEIKGEVSGAGGKFATSLYAVQITKLNDIVKLELVNLSFTGAALGVFIDAKIKINGTVLELGGKGPEKKKGATKYFEPTIIERGIREDILDKCVMIDEELQKYFDSKSLIPKELEGAAIIVEAVKEIAPESDDLPF